MENYIEFNGSYYIIIKKGHHPIFTAGKTTAIKLFLNTPEYYKEAK